MIAYEKLLGFKPSTVPEKISQNIYKGQTVLITGAAGFIGIELVYLLQFLECSQLILLDKSESELYNLEQYFKLQNFKNISIVVADICDNISASKIFKTYQPQIVFHAAAYKHVPLMEKFPYEAVKTNVLGTKIIADLALKHKVEKFVFISTDKAVNPTNVMGATKRASEKYVSCLNNKAETKFIITRFGNVLGSNGSVIPLFESQIKNGGPLTVTHKDITRYFMTIPEACQLVLEAGAMGQGGEIFVFDMGQSVKIFDLAKNMIRLSGLKYPEDIDIKISGLRPGEKLYEELLSAKETTLETYHEKIKIAKVSSLNCTAIQYKITALCQRNFKNDLELVAQLKEIVPEYISNNSVFEALDSKSDILEDVSI